MEKTAWKGLPRVLLLLLTLASGSGATVLSLVSNAPYGARFNSGQPTCTLNGGARNLPVDPMGAAVVAAAGTYSCPPIQSPRDATLSVQYAPAKGVPQDSGNIAVANNVWENKNTGFSLQEGDQVTVNVTLHCPTVGVATVNFGPAAGSATCRHVPGP